MTRIRRLAFWFALVLTSGSCTTTKEPVLIPEGVKLTLQSISIKAAAGANRGRPVPLDIVYVYERDALKRLNGYTANGWFSVKDTGLIDWKGQAEWREYVFNPGDEKQLTELPTPGRMPIALVFFARYPNTALHRFIVVGGSQIEVQLNEGGFVVGGT